MGGTIYTQSTRYHLYIHLKLSDSPLPAWKHFILDGTNPKKRVSSSSPNRQPSFTCSKYSMLPPYCPEHRSSQKSVGGCLPASGSAASVLCVMGPSVSDVYMRLREAPTHAGENRVSAPHSSVGDLLDIPM